MAMQAGMGVSKIVILVGAGLEKSGDSSNVETDPIATQVRQLASARQIIVLNGSSGGLDVTSLIIPVGALGALGYGYMWWKGLSFSDLMYVTKKSMAVAVANLTKHLEGVSDAVAVCSARDDLSRIGSEFLQLKNTVESLDEKVSTIEGKQNLTLMGLDYLCKFADGRQVPSYPMFLREQLAAASSRGQLPSVETTLIQGVKDIADNLSWTKMMGDGSGQDVIDTPNKPRSVTRTSSMKIAIPGI